MSSPSVSILLPVHNEERYLPEALTSMQRQTFTDWELVVVDDGSTDATAQILAEAARSDRRIRVIKQENLGIAASLNRGLSHCRAEIVARMDGDDISHPRRLELQSQLLRDNPQIDLVACEVQHFPRPTLQEGMKAYEAWQNGLVEHEEIELDLYVESPFAHPSVLFRRKIVADLGGYRQLAWAEDYDLWLRMASSGARFTRLRKKLFFWRDRPERLTRTAANCSAEAFRMCKAHFLVEGYLRGIDSVTLWGSGLEGKAWRKALMAQNIRVERWIEIDRRKIGQTIHGAPVVPINELAPDQGKMLITIGAKGARAQVRQWAEERGLVEGKDFVCVT